MIYKKALICKTKNLFDVSKADVTREDGYWSSNVGAGSNFYKLNTLSTEDKQYSITYEYFSNSLVGGEQLLLSVQTGDKYNDGTRLSIVLSPKTNGQWRAHHITFTVPANTEYITLSTNSGTAYFRNFQVYEGSTATNYVPYGYLQSYKKVIKVSDICQLLDKSKFPATYIDQGVTYTNNGDGTVTVNGTSTSTYYSNYQIPIDIKHCIPLHKYAILSTGIMDDAGSTSYTSQIIIASYPVGQYVYRGPNNIYEMPDHEGYYNFRWEIRVNKGITVTNLVCKPQLFDLTEMYGAGNEPKTVAEFRQKFPDDLYPYRPYCFVYSSKKYLKIKENNNA